ncbi:hypothetical protein PtB15_12B453 [Puccinia triticina]|nr:hypothetical protein PtB15_12B453 [Puccinia triticina]
MQQATAFVKQLAGIRPQDEEGTEDPAATPQGEIDEVPDLNPPKKTKKTTAPKEPTRKIATRSTSKVPEDPPQPKKAQQIELDGWERLLKDVGQRPSNRAHNPEERTEAASNDRAQNKRGWPGSVKPSLSRRRANTKRNPGGSASSRSTTSLENPGNAGQDGGEGDESRRERRHGAGKPPLRHRSGSWTSGTEIKPDSSSTDSEGNGAGPRND